MVLSRMQSTARVSTRVDVDPAGAADADPAGRSAPLRLHRAEGRADPEGKHRHRPPLRPRAPARRSAPVPTLSVITLSGEDLTQTDYAWKEGNAAVLDLQRTTPTSTTTLMTKVSTDPRADRSSPTTATRNGVPQRNRLRGAAERNRRPHTIQVDGRADDRARERDLRRTKPIRPGSRTAPRFRLTAPSYNPNAPSLPCQ